MSACSVVTLGGPNTQLPYMAFERVSNTGTAHQDLLGVATVLCCRPLWCCRHAFTITTTYSYIPQLKQKTSGETSPGCTPQTFTTATSQQTTTLSQALAGGFLDVLHRRQAIHPDPQPKGAAQGMILEPRAHAPVLATTDHDDSGGMLQQILHSA